MTLAIPAAGVSPASSDWENPAGAAPAARNWLADRIDPTTAELLSIRSGWHPYDAAIAYAFQVKFGSGAAIGGAGHLFADIKKAGPRAEQEIRLEAMRLLDAFVKRGWIKLDPTQGVIVAVNLDTGSLVVNYWNLATGKKQTPEFQLA